MRKADDGLRKLIHDKLPRSAGFVWTPIETGGTIAGVPDSFWAHESLKSGWLESKATDGWAVDVRPHQVSWVRSNIAMGVHVLIAVRAKGKGSSDGRGDSLWVIRGSAIVDLQDYGLKLPESAVLGRWYGGPRSWDMERVKGLLLGDYF